MRAVAARPSVAAEVNIQNLHLLEWSAGYAMIAIAADDRGRAGAAIGDVSGI